MLSAATMVHVDDEVGDICSNRGEQTHVIDADASPFVFIFSSACNGVEDRERSNALSILISALAEDDNSDNSC